MTFYCYSILLFTMSLLNNCFILKIIIMILNHPLFFGFFCILSRILHLYYNLLLLDNVIIIKLNTPITIHYHKLFY